MRRCFRIWTALILAIVLAACGGEPSRQPVSVPAMPEPGAGEAAPAAPQPAPPAPPPAPAEVTAPPAKPIAEIDLDADGQPEQLFISDDRQLRVIDKAGKERFAVSPRSLMRTAEVELFTLPDGPPLVRVHWPACPYGYPDNLFITYDREKQAVVSDRDPTTIMSCGTYEHLGDGRFETVSRNNQLYYHSIRLWQQDHFLVQSEEMRLSRIRTDQLTATLDTLPAEDIANPEVLFASPALYRQFQSIRKQAQHLENPTHPDPSSMLLQAVANGKVTGQLLVTYEEDPKNQPFILITGLEFSSSAPQR